MMLKVSRILHAGYLFEYDGARIAFDPLFENPFSRNCFAFPSVEFDKEAIAALKLDAIFISHYHDDHFSLESLQLLDRNIPIYIFCIFDELLDLLKGLGFKAVHSVEILRPIAIGPFDILPLEALDADVDSIFHIKVAGLNILNVVDSWIGPKTMDQLLNTKWDLALWPMQTMRELEVLAPASAEPVSSATRKLPPEWVEQLEELKPGAIVPSACQFRFEEWSWYNHAFFPISYAQFEKQVAEILPQSLILKLNPGESLCFTNGHFLRTDRISWIKPVGIQDVDYEFKGEITPQSIAEISTKLPSPSQKQELMVQEFCEDGILKRFTKLSPNEDSYFSKPRLWRLCVFNGDGLRTDYQYKVHHNQMNRVPVTEEWAWKTEIPTIKLYGALAEGESLTSIYARVHNPAPWDLFEDPLVRCLYQGILGGYQKAQLEKILLQCPEHNVVLNEAQEIS